MSIAEVCLPARQEITGLGLEILKNWGRHFYTVSQERKGTRTLSEKAEGRLRLWRGKSRILEGKEV